MQVGVHEDSNDNAVRERRCIQAMVENFNIKLVDSQPANSGVTRALIISC